jgi:endonuclease/exonuclease/phosphatase family metal-dependent hydrolase
LVLLVLARAPDVVCLQEVVPRVAVAVRASQVLARRYDVSPNDVTPYGGLILARTPLRATFREIELASDMGRTLLIADLRPGPGTRENWKAGAVATVHLESLSSAPTRRAQLRVCAGELQRSTAFPNAVL